MDEAIIQWLLTNGVDPTPYMLTGDVGDADDIVKLLNSSLLVNDKQNSAAVDVFGPRAMLGAGGYNLSQFQPQRAFIAAPELQRMMSYQQVLQSAPVGQEMSYAESLAQSGQITSLDDLIAYGLAAGGAGAAMGLINAAIQQPQTMLGQIVSSQAVPMYDETTGAYRTDTLDRRALMDRVYAVENNIRDQQAETQTARYDPQAGFYTETPTDLMEKFDEYGIPYPTQQYTPEYMMESIQPGWTSEMQGVTGGAGPEQFVQQGLRQSDALRRAMLEQALPIGRQMRQPTSWSGVDSPTVTGKLADVNRRATEMGLTTGRETPVPTGITRDGYALGSYEHLIGDYDNSGTISTPGRTLTADDYTGRSREWLMQDSPETTRQKKQNVDKTGLRQAQQAWTAQNDIVNQGLTGTFGDDYMKNAYLSFILQRQGRSPMIDTLTRQTSLGPVTQEDNDAWSTYAAQNTPRGQANQAIKKQYQERLKKTKKAVDSAKGKVR